MKAFIKVLLFIVVIGGLVLYVVSRQNNTSFTPQTIDLSVDCSELDNVLVTSTVNVVVKNLSSRSHSDVSVQIKAFDEAGNVLKEKYTTFSRTLSPSSTFDKPVTLPPKPNAATVKSLAHIRCRSSHPNGVPGLKNVTADKFSGE